MEADFAFHRAVAAATDNRFYLDLLDSLGPMMIMLPRTRLAEEYSLTDAAHVERVQREHDNIAAAVLAGDAETARAAMRVHLGNTRRRLSPEPAGGGSHHGMRGGSPHPVSELSPREAVAMPAPARNLRPPTSAPHQRAVFGLERPGRSMRM